MFDQPKIPQTLLKTSALGDNAMRLTTSNYSATLLQINTLPSPSETSGKSCLEQHLGP